MNTSNFPIEHKYNIGDIITLPNKYNNKSVICKVNHITLDFRPNSSTTAITKHATFMGYMYSYMIYYHVETLEGSYYDIDRLEEFPKTTLVLNLE